MNNFISFFNTFFSYILVVIVIVIVIIIAAKLGVMWSKKNDEKKALEAAEAERLEAEEMTSKE